MKFDEKKRYVFGEFIFFSKVDFGDYIFILLDGGWGWVVVFSFFMCNLIVDGFGYFFGVLLFLWVNVF